MPLNQHSFLMANPLSVFYYFADFVFSEQPSGSVPGSEGPGEGDAIRDAGVPGGRTTARYGVPVFSQCFYISGIWSFHHQDILH